MRHKQHHIQRVAGKVNAEIKWPCHKADRAPPTSAEVKSEYIYTFSPPYGIMECT